MILRRWINIIFLWPGKPGPSFFRGVEACREARECKGLRCSVHTSHKAMWACNISHKTQGKLAAYYTWVAISLPPRVNPFQQKCPVHIIHFWISPMAECSSTWKALNICLFIFNKIEWELKFSVIRKNNSCIWALVFFKPCSNHVSSC